MFLPSFLWHLFFFFFNDSATTEIYTLSLHDALPISAAVRASTPPPPCSFGMPYEVRPALAAFASRSGGKSSFTSHSEAIGLSSRSENSCASACSSRCSSVNSNETGISERKELDAAADVELDPGDIAGEVGTEEGDRIRDVLRLARATHGRPTDHPLVHLRVAEVERLGSDHAGDDRVHRDPVPGALERERARQAEKPRLGRDRKSTRL